METVGREMDEKNGQGQLDGGGECVASVVMDEICSGWA